MEWRVFRTVLAGTVWAATLAAWPQVTIGAADAELLEAECQRLLLGCRRTALDGTVMFTPDGKGHYGALWTRDFAYMVEGAGDLLRGEEIDAAIRCLLAGLREDGTAPDRVQVDGLPVYSAGPIDRPLGAPPTDNSQFLVKLVWSQWKRAGKPELARQAVPKLIRSMNAVPRRDGLVWIDPATRRSPYGFTDTVAKTGFELFSSLLDREASKNLAEMCVALGRPDCGDEFLRRAGGIECRLGALWSPQKGAYLAASQACRQVDIWGNAYAIYIGFPLGERRGRILDFLEKNVHAYLWRGQVRHLLLGEYWDRLLVDVKRDTYQNGGYWATASGWVAYALAERRPELATRLFAELADDIRRYGACEWIHGETHQLCGYVVSAVNSRAALRRLRAEGRLAEKR